MWYVIQTETGKEETAAESVNHVISRQTYERCFCPKRVFLKRIKGEWIRQKAPLFPGYFFIISEQPERLFFQLKEIPGITKILGDDSYHFIPLYPREEEFYKTLFRESGEGAVELSEISVEDDGSIRCLGGVLKSLERDIMRINVKKRYAVVRSFLLGDERTVLLGIRLGKDKA